MSTADPTRAPAPRLRFSMRRMLAAAFWMALGCGAWAVILHADAGAASREFGIVVVYAAITAPILAIGEWFERKVSGVLIATSVWLLLLCLWVLMVG